MPGTKQESNKWAFLIIAIREAEDPETTPKLPHPKYLMNEPLFSESCREGMGEGKIKRNWCLGAIFLRRFAYGAIQDAGWGSPCFKASSQGSCHTTLRSSPQPMLIAIFCVSPDAGWLVQWKVLISGRRWCWRWLTALSLCPG